MKALKSLIEKLQANIWVFWFIGVFAVLYISQQIHNESINFILFAEYQNIASVIEAWVFLSIMAYIILKWVHLYLIKKGGHNG
jgi:hypothetical protein